MSADDQVTAHFGLGGMRRFSSSGLYGAPLPEEAEGVLQGVGVPTAVAPYFRASESGAPVSLRAHAARHRRDTPPSELARWVRIGGDAGAEICVRPDGGLQAVFLSPGAEDMFVSTNVDLFNQSLVLLDRALPRIAASGGVAQAVDVFRDLSGSLKELDPTAFAERESWWPRLLDDVRHTLNFPFSAAFEFRLEGGRTEIVTDRTGPGRLHPEERVWQRLESSGVGPEQVTRVYCELEPCMMPGHYCALWLQRLFPHAEFTHSFGYGDTAAAREEGFKDMIVHAAEQARGGRG